MVDLDAAAPQEFNQVAGRDRQLAACKDPLAAQRLFSFVIGCSCVSIRYQIYRCPSDVDGVVAQMISAQSITYSTSER